MADVRIASFGTNHEAELARLYLDENGFDVRLEDDMLVGTALPLEAVLGGVKMFAPADQAEDARLALEEFRTASMRERAPETGDDQLKRAFRIAVVGLFLCPGVLHLWSLAMALNVPATELSRRSLRLHRFTVAFDVVVVIAAAVALFDTLTTPPEPPPPPPPEPVFFGTGGFD
jgi:hypothetical protein